MLELDLAELARERQDHAAAALHYAMALAVLPAGDAARRLLAHRGRASSLYRLGRSVEASADFGEAHRLAQELGDTELQIFILLDHATALDWGNDAPGSKRLAQEAQRISDATALRTHAVLAGLAVAKGRSLFREGKWPEARPVLEEAVAEAEQLGHTGYEALVIALILLEAVLPTLGLLDEAVRVSERAIALTTAKGDKLNLASALNNRRNVLVARGDLAGALADQQQFMRLGRELGLTLNEYFGEYNQAELLYQSGDARGAGPHALRAKAFESSHPEVASRPVASLLRARLLAFDGLVAEARTLLTEIEASTRSARARGQANGALAPSEEVLATMVDLSTRAASDAEWDALLSRSASHSVEQESIEILEMRARAALRNGRIPEADEYFARAIDAASRIPNVMGWRVRQGQESLPN